MDSWKDQTGGLTGPRRTRKCTDSTRRSHGKWGHSCTVGGCTETMAVWQTLGDDPSLPDYVVEYARIWRSKPKIVFSSTLDTVGENCRLVKADAAAEVGKLKQQPGGDLGVCGPGLATSLARLGLVDEFQLVVYPVIVGGGKRTSGAEQGGGPAASRDPHLQEGRGVPSLRAGLRDGGPAWRRPTVATGRLSFPRPSPSLTGTAQATM